MRRTGCSRSEGKIGGESAGGKLCAGETLLDIAGVLSHISLMRYPVMLERIPDEEGMPGFYYAHIPSLGLTTHGHGMEEALEAARDLATLWNEERRANGEPVIVGSEAILATVEVA
jgi:predicted RNase H-like HicB family nuclease